MRATGRHWHRGVARRGVARGDAVAGSAAVVAETTPHAPGLASGRRVFPLPAIDPVRRDERKPPVAVTRYTRPVTRTYVAVVVVEVVVLAALWFLSRHFAA